MDTIPPETKKTSFLRSHAFVYLLFFISLIGIWGFYITSAPTNSQSIANRQPVIIHVADGESLNAVTVDLQTRNVIRNSTVLKILLKVLKLDKQIARGDYMFDKNISSWRVTWMLARGDHHIDPIKITFKEGLTNKEIADILSDKLSVFRRDLFESDEKARQGYLFPDTYFFFPLTTSKEILSDVTANFSKHITPLESDIAKSGHTLDEIIIMASILEKEAKGEDDAPMIAGILWKRIDKGMPLQVDAARETYTEKGLPKVAISNPGMVSINASINPTQSNYLFYLHGKDGRVHFAETYNEHKANIAKYLK